jgi:UDP-N-acetyl-D-glucosamine/UDP-N-acetyl-D-galactosamine dehydrogenase
VPIEEMVSLDALILAVCHRWYLSAGQQRLMATLRDGGVLVDVKSALDPAAVERRIRYWSL